MNEFSEIQDCAEPPFKVINPERIPVERYYDEGFYQLEKEALWGKSWQMAARLDQIPNIGDFTVYTIFDRSVIVVNTPDGIKVHQNACRHRGVALAKGHGNCKAQGFICPFHGWRWNSEGENTFVYGRHLFSADALDSSELDLPQVRSEIFGGCVFINFDSSAPSFRETIGPLADSLEAHAVSELKAEWWYSTVLPANWKVALEAFMEGYHVMRTHPQLQRANPATFNGLYGQETGGIGLLTNPNMSMRDNIYAHFAQLELVSEGMSGMIHAKEVDIARQLLDIDLPDDPQEAVVAWYTRVNAEITRQLRERGEPVPDLNAVAASHPLHAVELLFPHYMLLPTFSSMSAYRVRPLTAETCTFEIWSLTLKGPNDTWESPREPIVLPFDSQEFPPIPQQDYQNIPEQQIGLHAPDFK
ncbi:MAG: aromatic ring-hydroxylating dioxygenase subunit alpha, partial [Alphaproteobacteria bacterium]